jgi:hypothetical protein
MKANELRIGNLVNTINGIKKVSDISVDRYCWFLDNQCEPISLTEDWLLKFGFKHSGNAFYIHIPSLIEVANIGNDFFYCGRKGVSLCNIKYVHELQNIHFALKRTEFTVVVS